MDKIRELTKEQENELKRLKQYFPYRIIFGLFIDEKFCTFAMTTKGKMNRFIKSGYIIYRLG